eukprot:CAMPEP_0168491378 /NCGR_PEP_ID=MMETSP0228-20121227/69664_1 /TAXON_ID=133427 /ORGANISM="Protoceratium reticulatum, Strain CCCM 535 (=CCMP 1889)" /LENGTH=42 /DNA_ID= /DNA_START= /DNA_END= /DNA_ORIENTATION=
MKRSMYQDAHRRRSSTGRLETHPSALRASGGASCWSSLKARL